VIRKTENYFEQTEAIRKIVRNAEINNLRGINKTKYSLGFPKLRPPMSSSCQGLKNSPRLAVLPPSESMPAPPSAGEKCSATGYANSSS
jgi:hypothetical protein